MLGMVGNPQVTALGEAVRARLLRVRGGVAG